MTLDPNQFEFVSVTPELAKKWLSDNDFARQRVVRDHHILTLAEEIEAGNFIAHSAIVFAQFGQERYLIDGQHRLNAIVLAGKNVSMTILTKIAESKSQIERWYASIDQGLKRSARDAIKAQNIHEELGVSERHAGRLSAAVKLIASGFQEVGKGTAAKTAGRSNLVVSDLMMEWASESREYYSLIAGGEKSRMYLFDRAAVIASALITLRYVPEKAKEFWRGMAQDDGLAREDPRKRFLLWLDENKERPLLTAKAFAVAWRAFCEDRQIALIRFTATQPVKFVGVPLERVIRGTGIELSRIESWRQGRIDEAIETGAH